jgi:ATP-binding cassette subfamily F protein uup
VLLVTHDRVFLDNVVTSTIAFEGDGRVVEYVGGWADYVRQAKDAGLMNEGRAKAAPAERERSDRPDRSDRSDRRKKTFNEEREYAALPARIEALEDEHRRLHEEIAGADFYKAAADHIRTVLARVEEVGVELEQALARWLELEEIGKS